MIERFLRLFKAYRQLRSDSESDQIVLRGQTRELAKLQERHNLIEQELRQARAKCDQWEERYIECAKDAQVAREYVADWQSLTHYGTTIFGRAPVVPPAKIDYSKIKTAGGGIHARVLQQQALNKFYQQHAAQFKQAAPPMESGHDITDPPEAA